MMSNWRVVIIGDARGARRLIYQNNEGIGRDLEPAIGDDCALGSVAVDMP
jgi:hypothetical protein